MNIWTVILLTLVSVGLVFYFLVAVVGVKTGKLFGPPLMISISVVLVAGLSYYLVSEKSIYVVIKSGESILRKSSIEFNDEMWQNDELFMFSSVTRGVPVIDYTQLVKDFLASDEARLCRDYQSDDRGSGRYKKEAGTVTVCVNKKGIRWYF